MWTQILLYVLLTVFVLCYAVTGYYFADLFGDGKSKFKKYLIGLFWPVIIAFVMLIFSALFVAAFILVILFVFAVMFNICRSLIKGEKIDWDKPIF